MSADNDFGPAETAAVIKRLVSTNAASARTAGPLEALPRHPRLRLAILTCMDARVDVSSALGLAAGDAHTIRNAGGIVTDDVLRSLIVSQWCLGTRGIMVIQHTDCGMLTLDESDLESRIQRQTGRSLPFALGAFRHLETSVRESVDRLRNNELLPARDHISGYVYDVETRLLREVAAS